MCQPIRVSTPLSRCWERLRRINGVNDGPHGKNHELLQSMQTRLLFADGVRFSKGTASKPAAISSPDSRLQDIGAEKRGTEEAQCP
jgi:hypothetical protein